MYIHIHVCMHECVHVCVSNGSPANIRLSLLARVCAKILQQVHMCRQESFDESVKEADGRFILYYKDQTELATDTPFTHALIDALIIL